MTSTLSVIGRNTVVSLGGVEAVPAKVDTGADSSSVWASDIREEADGLHFTLFGEASPYYTGAELTVPNGHYRQQKVVSSTGGREKRYVVELEVTAEGQTVQADFSLADRLTLSYPVLLGCSFLANRFLVDCAKEIPADLHQELTRHKHARRRAAEE